MHTVDYGDQTLWQCDECPRNFLSQHHAERHAEMVHGAHEDHERAPTRKTETAEPVAEPPSPVARKAEWIAYAQSRGIDTDGLTKAQLIQRSTR